MKITITSSLLVGFIFLTLYTNNLYCVESQIIRLIDQQCDEEGECYISLAGITSFKWDTVSIFIAGGDWLEINEAIGLGSEDTELQNGIVFSYNGRVVKKHISNYDFLTRNHPRLTYWIERSPEEPYYKSYSRDKALVRAEKIKTKNEKYRYILVG